jgi:acyl dehydratase
VSAQFHFEDFHVGQVFALGPRLITAQEIKEFAAEFDPQPFHLDEVAAQSSVLGGLSASGFHSGALMLRMICDSFLSNSSILGSSHMERLTWLKPVYAGDELSGALEVTALRASQSRAQMGIMNFEAHLQDQAGARKVELAGTFFFGKRAP